MVKQQLSDDERHVRWYNSRRARVLRWFYYIPFNVKVHLKRRDGGARHARISARLIEQARVILRQWEDRLHPDAAERAELRAAGVPERTIADLYPDRGDRVEWDVNWAALAQAPAAAKRLRRVNRTRLTRAARAVPAHGRILPKDSSWLAAMKYEPQKLRQEDIIPFVLLMLVSATDPRTGGFNFGLWRMPYLLRTARRLASLLPERP